jgi:hypothetical protein
VTKVQGVQVAFLRHHLSRTVNVFLFVTVPVSCVAHSLFQYLSWCFFVLCSVVILCVAIAQSRGFCQNMASLFVNSRHRSRLQHPLIWKDVGDLNRVGRNLLGGVAYTYFDC